MISEFSGRYRFLSNFYPCLIEYDGGQYPSVEHAYQAAKFPKDKRVKFQNAAVKAGQAKAMGRGKGGPDWHSKSLDIMLELLRIKFGYPQLREQLRRTGNEQLEEGNWWGDTFFGVCNGVGHNHLGRLLMKVRTEIDD